MRSRVILIGVSILFVVAACGRGRQELTPTEKELYAALGDSIATASQSQLLRNVAGAIQRGGVDFALEFCNTRAMDLTDSLSNSYSTKIRRLSDKTRNAANAIQTTTDSLAWQALRAGNLNFVVRGDDRSVFYYKPILLGMPTCLKCHGGKTDIAESTHKLISRLYPHDRATARTAESPPS